MKLKFFRCLILLLILFQFQDAFCTYLGIRAYGLEIEGNPLIRFLIGLIGLKMGLIIPKVIGIILLSLVYKTSINRKPGNVIFGMVVFLNLFYMWAAANWFGFLFYTGIL
jgi:hypothetical protein